MAAMSSAPAARAPRIQKNRKGGTEASNRKHVFKSFGHRIANLKIDPVRRGRSTILDDAELDTTFSYFKNSLDEWRDLNISDGFSHFARRVAPLCESLPQLLHHNERILDLLIEYIEKGDKWSEEPLLSLMAHFAHDLGVRFEKHFERVVRTVSQLAAKHEDVEVIEWSFTCLAWLFKYLSRLLVPDLRPIFDLMAPLLGKEHQRSFVTGFTAEALSFLLRKAGAAYHRDKEPLRLILGHIRKQLDAIPEVKRSQEFQQGVMSLLVDSMKGVQHGLHSSASAIFRELLFQAFDTATEESPPSDMEVVVTGVVIAIIHHSTADTFAPILELTIQQIRSANTESDRKSLGISMRLLFSITGVRKGDRIGDWKAVLETLRLLADRMNEAEKPEPGHKQDLLAACAVVFQYAPIDSAIPHVQLLELVSKGAYEESFLPFCILFAEIGTERFRSLLLPYFKRFIVAKAYQHGDELCVILPKLYNQGALPIRTISMSKLWCDQVVGQFEELASPTADTNLERLTDICNSFLETSRIITVDADFKQNILTHLNNLLEKTLNGDCRAPSDSLALGNGLLFLLQESQQRNGFARLWPSLAALAPMYGHMVPFWEALRVLIKTNPNEFDFERDHIEPLKRTLMLCLGSPSHHLRLASLEVLELVVQNNEHVRTVVNNATMIEQTPFTFQNARVISMHIRELGASYESVSDNKWAAEAIPAYCFGLLHAKLAQAWDNACSTLQKICETKPGEGFTSQIAFEWLSNCESTDFTDVNDNENKSTPRRYVTAFECTNHESLKEMVSKYRDSEAITEDLRNQFRNQHIRVPFRNLFSRTQSLRVLTALPQVAEKRSRFLVPVLLDWVSDPNSVELPGEDVLEEEEASAPDSSHWSQKDRKAMLVLFSKFGNPKVLFKSGEVYAALLMLLTNGDADIQKAALKAVLTWKEPAIIRYQENLFNLVDDARFRDEISVFLDGSEEDNHLRQEHREQLMPIILRLLYGKVISGRKGQEAKRKAVFIALTRFNENAIREFLKIAFGPLSQLSILKEGSLADTVVSSERMAPRKQLGLLHMLEDMLGTFKTTLAPFVGDIVNPLLYCLIRSSRILNTVATTDEPSTNIQTSLLRLIRQRGFHSLNMLFESCPEFHWHPYVPAIVQEIVNPRLDQFPIETAQSVSGLLRLFSAWSKSWYTAMFLVESNRNIVTKIVECLEVPSAKDDVKRFVLDNILRTVIQLVDVDEGASVDVKLQRNRIHTDIIQPYSNAILSTVGGVLRKSPSKDVLESAVKTIAELAPHLTGSSESRSMIEISTFLLKQPSRRVNYPTKQGLLRILHGFIPRCDEATVESLLTSILDACCPMFATARDPASRTLLSQLIADLSETQGDLARVAEMCENLNSFSASRLDEPDFERRSKAFDQINEEEYLKFSSRQWQPLIYNMLFFIKDNEELSIRVNASLSLRRFVDASVSNRSLDNLLLSAVFPGIQQGVREESELVRVEFLAVLGHLVSSRPDWSQTADLRVLLHDDEDSSFFDNVLHIQSHRRLRAIRRLASCASKLHSGNISHLLIPLLENFIYYERKDETAHNLAGESTKAVGALAEWLEWPQFRSFLKRTIDHLKTKEDMQKTIIRLIGALMDALSQAGHAKGYVDASPSKDSGAETEVPRAPDDEEMETDDPAEDGDKMELDTPVSTLAKTLPQHEKLSSDLTNNILPSLTEFLHNKDETTVSLRVPIAVAATKVLQVLPPREIETRLPAVLLDICHILKSKSQDGRDMARNTLADIALLMGPRYVGFILKSLRTALRSGYQLHVLSFTLHHILVKLSPEMKPGDLDYCLYDIVTVVMDDIFGVTGQEKDAEEYISKMKEVKSSKSYDTMDIVSRCSTPQHFFDLVWPIKSLLQEKLTVKLVSKIDELLRRIGLGILQNPTVKDRDILIFCYELIQDVYKVSSAPARGKPEDPRSKRYLVNMRGAAKSGARGSTSSYLYKITRFSLDILRAVLHKHEGLQTPENMTGFLPILGDALVQGQEEVQVSAVRLLTTIIKVPLPKLDEDCPVYVTEAVRNIKHAPSTNTELAQASLKLISAVLRERQDVTVKERDLAQLLKKLLPDLDEPDRQGVTFGFLKAVMSRKIVITEVYEVMDKVATMMVTNHTRSARDLARSHYFQFLTEYPQAKSRFTKQIEFLVRNLRYEHVEGRQSVMEALHLVLTKIGDNVLQDVLSTLFIPLIHSMANDESSDCRTMAGALLKKLFERADAERTKGFVSDLRAWLEQDEDTGLKRLGIQCWGLLLEVGEIKPKELKFILRHLETTVQECLERRDEDDWELIYYSLTTFQKICKTSPENTFSPKHKDFWKSIQTCASYPHAWVKLTAAKLIGTYFADFASTSGEEGLKDLPLHGSQGLQLTAVDMIQLANTFLKNLHVSQVGEDLCGQSVRNLAFLARCFAVNSAKWEWENLGDDEEADEDVDEGLPEAAKLDDITPKESDEEEDEFGGFSPEPSPEPRAQNGGEATSTTRPTAIHRLITRLSALIRRETKILKPSALYPKTATMTLLHTLSAKLPPASLASSLPHLLTTLHTLADPLTTHPHSSDPTFNDTYKALIDKAREIMVTLQKRIGTQEYLKVMSEVEKGIRGRRDERRRKRVMERVADPEAYGREKRRRLGQKMERRKRKGEEGRGKRRGW